MVFLCLTSLFKTRQSSRRLLLWFLKDNHSVLWISLLEEISAINFIGFVSRQGRKMGVLLLGIKNCQELSYWSVSVHRSSKPVQIFPCRLHSSLKTWNKKYFDSWKYFDFSIIVPCSSFPTWIPPQNHKKIYIFPPYCFPNHPSKPIKISWIPRSRAGGRKMMGPARNSFHCVVSQSAEWPFVRGPFKPIIGM